MCGIAGILLSSDQGRDVRQQQRLARMLEVQLHRGPDAGGQWADDRGRCLLGHRRLSIIDLSDDGRQPMPDPSGRWVITFNGEIYNYLDLRKRLEDLGTVFRTRTDTEVLAAALERWGTKCLEEMDGMFAFAAFDTHTGDFLMARDPFGEKPLYFGELEGGGLGFASELRALEVAGLKDSSVSVDAIAEYLTFQYIGSPRSIYRSVQKLPPGSFFEKKAGLNPRIVRYFEFSPARHTSNATFDVLLEELEEILTRSLSRRLVADVPLGAFLSGGVDSSTAVALATRLSGRQLQTFSIGFEGVEDSEHEIARQFAALIGSQHRDQILKPDASAFVLDAGRFLDEPNGDTSCLPTYLLCQFARKFVTVSISGDGGDELFGGYGRYMATLAEAVSADANGDHSWWPGNAYYSERILTFPESTLRNLLGGIPRDAFNHFSALRQEITTHRGDLLSILRKSDVENYMPGAVLPKVDRMSMQHALEVRTPFLSIELARFAEKLPSKFLVKKDSGKILLRELACRMLPREMIYMPKRGFGLPASVWGERELTDLSDSLLRSAESRFANFAGRKRINAYLDRQVPGNFNTYQVWALCILESWLRERKVDLPEAQQIRSSFAKPSLLLSESWRVEVVHHALATGRECVLVGDTVETPEALQGAEVKWVSTLEEETDEAVSEKKLLEQVLEIAKPGAVVAVLAEKPEAILNGDALAALRGRGVASVCIVDETALGRDWMQLDFSREPPDLRKLRNRALRIHAGKVWEVAREPFDERLHSMRSSTWGGLVQLMVEALRWLHSKGENNAWLKKKQPAMVKALEAIQVAVCASNPSGALWVAKLPRGLPNKDLHETTLLFCGEVAYPPIQSQFERIGELGKGRYLLTRDWLYFSPLEGTRLQDPVWIAKIDPQDGSLPYQIKRLPRYDAATDALAKAVRSFSPKHEEIRPLAPGAKIQVYTHTLAPGGAERQWCYLAIALQERGYDVEFLVQYWLRGEKAHYLPLLEQARVPVRVLQEVPFSERDAIAAQEVGNPVIWPAVRVFSRGDTLSLVAVIRRFRPDCILSQLDYPNLLAGCMGLAMGVPKVTLSFRGMNPTHYEPEESTKMYRPIYRALAEQKRIVFTANSRSGGQDYANWLEIPEEQVIYSPNCVLEPSLAQDREVCRSEIRKELGLGEEARLILGVFRLSQEKCPLVFVQTCCQVLGKCPEAYAVVAGVGPLEEAMREAIHKAGLSQRIFLIGRRDDVPRWMAAADILLLTSKAEGTPNVVLEALAMGLPVVATAAGDTPELVRDGETGFLRPIGDVEGLASAVEGLLTKDSLRTAFADSGRSLIRQRFSIEAMVERALSILR